MSLQPMKVHAQTPLKWITLCDLYSQSYVVTVSDLQIEQLGLCSSDLHYSGLSPSLYDCMDENFGAQYKMK